MKKLDNINILYCEDDRILRNVFSIQLEYHFGSNLNLTKCSNGFAAMEIINSDQTVPSYDLIIADHDMKIIGGDGLSLFNWLCEKKIYIPFILLTSKIMCDLERQPLEKNFHYMFKVQEFEKIAKKIDSLLYNSCLT